MLIPLSDENPTRHIPFVTIALVAANIGIFIWEVSLPVDQLNRYIMANAFIPTRFAANPLSLAVWATIFVSMFLHGGWLHVGGNMLYLWIFGNNIEDRLGPLRFLGFYLVCGVAATLTQFAAAPAADVPNIGASGAIAGVLGAYVLLYPTVPVLTLIPIFFFFTIARVSAVFVIGFWFVLQLLSGFASLGVTSSHAGGVAFFAHVGGFIAGLVLILPAWMADRRRRPPDRSAAEGF